MSKDNNQQTTNKYVTSAMKELPIDGSANEIAKEVKISRNKLRGALKAVDLAQDVILHPTANQYKETSTVAWSIPYETKHLFLKLAEARKNKNAAKQEILENETFHLLAEMLDERLQCKLPLENFSLSSYTKSSFADTVLLMQECVQERLLEKQRAHLRDRLHALEAILREKTSPVEMLTRMKKVYAVIDDILIELTSEKQKSTDENIKNGVDSQKSESLKALYQALVEPRTKRIRQAEEIREANTMDTKRSWNIFPLNSSENGKQAAKEFENQLVAMKSAKLSPKHTEDYTKKKRSRDEQLAIALNKYLYSALDESKRTSVDQFAKEYMELKRYAESSNTEIAIDIMKSKLREYVINLFSDLENGYFITYSSSIDVPEKTIHTGDFQFFDRQFRNMCDHISYSVFHELVWICKLRTYCDIQRQMEAVSSSFLLGNYDALAEKTWTHILNVWMKVGKTPLVKVSAKSMCACTDENIINYIFEGIFSVWKDIAKPFLGDSSLACMVQDSSFLANQFIGGSDRIKIQILSYLLQMICIVHAVRQAESCLEQVKESQKHLSDYLQFYK